MVYSRYGFSFHFMKEQDIEQVRLWRNDPVVANNYEYRVHITPEMQVNWFRSVNNINNLYTIIEYQGERIGVINLKNIDWEARTCEGGIFLPDPKYHQTYIPAIISYITTEIIFVIFDWGVGTAHVLKENRSVQQFVKMLGYELLPGQEEVNNQEYRITRESFEKYAPKLRKAISVLVGNDQPGVLSMEPSELSDPMMLQWEEMIKASRHIKKVDDTPGGRVYLFS